MNPAAVLSILVKAQGVKVATTQLGMLETASRKAGDAADSMSSKHQKSSEAISKASKVGVIAVGALAAGAVKMAADYEQSMNTLQAVSGATGAQMKDLGKLAVKLGADVKLPGTSAQDAAEAMQEMIKAGVSMRDTMQGVRGVLVLSAAAQVSNARAAEIASNALNTFKLKGKDVNFVVDQLANTANASSVEIEDVAQAMKMAGSVFSAFQGPVRGAKGAMTDLNVAIGLLGNAGIKGSDAGTSLKQTLLQLTGPSDRAKGAMEALYAAAIDNSTSQEQLGKVIRGGAKDRGAAIKSLEKMNPALKNGGDIAYDSAGKMRGLKDIIALVAKGTAKMTAEQRDAYVTQIFGADATRTVIALMQAGPKAWDKMTASVTRQGAAQALAEAKMKGLKGSIEALKSTAETLAISFGTVLLPPLTKVFQKLASFGPFIENNKTLIMVLVGALGALAAGTWAVNLAMAANPFVAAAVAIALLVAGIVKAYQSSETFRKVILAVFDAIKTAFTATVNWIVAATNTVVGEIKQWDTLFSAIGRGFDLVKAQAVEFFTVLKVIFSAGMLVLGPIAAAAWKLIEDVFSAAWSVLKGYVVGGLQIIRGVITIFGGLFKGDFGQVWDGIKQVFKGGLTQVKGVLEGAWKLLKAPVDAIGAGIHDAFSHSWDRIKALFTSSINAVIGFLNLLIKAINVIPGVPDIKPIGTIGGGGGGGGGDKQQNLGGSGHLARGGAFGATGGLINRPMTFMGEEAPHHPEYVIPTNPAYRKRAVGLLGQAAGAIGLAEGGTFGYNGTGNGPYMTKGEIVNLAQKYNMPNPNLMAAIAMAESGGEIDAFGPPSGRGLWQIEWNVWGKQFAGLNPNNPADNAVMARRVLDAQGLGAWVAYNNGNYKQFLGGAGADVLGPGIGTALLDTAKSIIDSLPSPKDLGWLGGLGKYALGKVKDWIGDNVGGLLGGGGGGGSHRIEEAIQFAAGMGFARPSLNQLTGGEHAAGSYHPQGRAADFGAAGHTVPQMEALFSGFMSKFGTSIKEMFYDPEGFYIKNGARVPGAIGGHSDHLHIALAQGGVWPFVGAFRSGGSVDKTGMALVHKGETVIPAVGFASGGINKGKPAGGVSHPVIGAIEAARRARIAAQLQKLIDAGKATPLKGGGGGAVAPAVVGGADDSNTNAIEDNTAAIEAQNTLLQQQLDLAQQQRDEARAAYNVSQSQYGILAQAVTDVVNRGIGTTLGLSLSGLRSPAGSVARS